MIIKIPNYKTLEIQHLVFDYNGTLAKDGILINTISQTLKTLCKEYTVHVITADTFGSVKKQLKEFKVTIKVLQSDNHTKEKADYVDLLGAATSAAFGNGNNDKEMLERAEIGIALVGDEGCSTQTLIHSDIGCTDILDAMELFLYPKRLIATLRA